MRDRFMTDIIFAKVIYSGTFVAMKAGRGIRSLGWAALLFGAVVAHLYAAEDGAFRLKYAVGNLGSAAILSSPAFDDAGNIYIGVANLNGTGRLLAINPADQNPRPKSGWAEGGISTEREIVSSPTVGPDGTVYFGCYDGCVYAVSGTNAQQKWKQKVGLFVTSSPTLSADGSVLYVGSGTVETDGTSGKNGLHALRTSDGSEVWVFKTSEQVESAPSLSADGTLYFGSHDKNIYAVRSADGSLRWSQTTGDKVISSPALGADGTVYVGSYDSYMYALQADTGAIKWRYKTRDAINASPVIGPDGTIFFGSTGSSFHAVNPDGSDRWSPIGTGAAVFGSAIVRSDGTVIFGDDKGVLRALYADSGAIKWSKNLSDNYIESSPAIARVDGSVYVGSSDGNLYGYYGLGIVSSYSAWPMFRHDLSHTGRATVFPEGGRLINLSTRAQAGEGKTLIAGLATGGSGVKNYLIRGAGPSLLASNVANALIDPALTIKSPGSNVVLYANDDWGQEANAAQIRQSFAQLGAFAFPDGSKDSAILRPLRGGLYTAELTGPRGISGVALVEAYDADQNDASTRLINLSARAYTGTGGDVLIAGLVVGGSAPVRVLVRGIGPTLTRFGVPAVLAQPSLSMFLAGASDAFVNNTGWSTSVQKGDVAGVSKLVGAFDLPDGSADCAALLTLNPGGYTIQISGVNNATGEALVEVYLLP